MRAVSPYSYLLPPSHAFSFPPVRLRISFKQQNQQQQQQRGSQDDGIPSDLAKALVNFKSHHNHIRVLQVSRTADHPFRGSRLLLLDSPGNIHSISFRFQTLTQTYFDVFATLPPLLPPGPIAILGFGAGSAAKILLNLYPHITIHGWEIDPAVIDVARDYFGLSSLEKQFPNTLRVHVGDALAEGCVDGGFAGVLVDLFSKGSLLPELQEAETWIAIRGRLKEGGRVMVNVGGSCVEAEESGRDGKMVMEETLKSMEAAGLQVNVLRLGNRGHDSSIALTGELSSSLDLWEAKLCKPLKHYVHMWTPYTSLEWFAME